MNPGDCCPANRGHALHRAVPATCRLPAGYFIKWYQQAPNYAVQLPWNTPTLKCHEEYHPNHADREPRDCTLISGLLSLTVTQLRFPSAEQGEASSLFQWSGTYSHWYVLPSPADTLLAPHACREAPSERGVRDGASFTSVRIHLSTAAASVAFPRCAPARNPLHFVSISP